MFLIFYYQDKYYSTKWQSALRRVSTAFSRRPLLRVLGGLRTQPFGLPRLATPLGHMSNHVTLPRTTWSVRSQAFYLTGDNFPFHH